MIDDYDIIINEIDIRQIGTDKLNATYPKPKGSELTPKQKKEIVDYYVSKNFKDVTAEDISRVAGIPLSKAKNFIGNTNKDARTNNIKTLQILTTYLNELGSL